jgi:hypothetical protein
MKKLKSRGLTKTELTRLRGLGLSHSFLIGAEEDWSGREVVNRRKLVGWCCFRTRQSVWQDRITPAAPMLIDNLAWSWRQRVFPMVSVAHPCFPEGGVVCLLLFLASNAIFIW